jgi:hypothetical protein
MCALEGKLTVFIFPALVPLSSTRRQLRKMATSGEHKSFCVLDFHVFGTDPPNGKSIRKWYLQFQDTRCVYERKSTGRPSTEEEGVELVRAKFVRSPWPPRSPDLTPWDFFLWGFIKDRVFVPPLPVTLVDLRTRITAAITVIDHDMPQTVWQELDHRFDVCRVTGGAYVEHL